MSGNIPVYFPTKTQTSYLIAVECDWLSTTMLYEHLEVVLEVLTNARQMMNYRNVVFLQLFCWSNPRQHEQLWWVDCPSTQYHLCAATQKLRGHPTIAEGVIFHCSLLLLNLSKLAEQLPPKIYQMLGLGTAELEKFTPDIWPITELNYTGAQLTTIFESPPCASPLCHQRFKLQQFIWNLKQTCHALIDRCPPSFPNLVKDEFTLRTRGKKFAIFARTWQKVRSQI